MLNKSSKRFVRATGVLALAIALPVQAASADLCLATGYTVGFFNGVWNTPVQAADGLAALRAMTGNTHDGQPIQYEVFYNVTGCETGSSAICIKADDGTPFSLQDLAEVFQQRAIEIDSTGQLGTRWELFWENLSGHKPFSDKLAELLPSAAGLLSQLYTELASKVAVGASRLASSPPTDIDYARHNLRLEALALQRQKLLLVAHSQGNLFLNQGYDHVRKSVGLDNVKAVHIAPASPTLRGEHVLANIDKVINALRIQGLSTVPAINLILAPSDEDASGHTLIKTYLDDTRSARAMVDRLMREALQQLVTPTTLGNQGAFTVTLTWDGAGDVDLHVYEPNGGQHVYYSNKQGIVGYLDVDNTVAYGPEHYYASCNPTILQEGIYRIGVNNYDGAAGRTATVQVASSQGGVLTTQQVAVREENQSSQGIPRVLDVVVSRNAATGAVSYAVR